MALVTDDPAEARHERLAAALAGLLALALGGAVGWVQWAGTDAARAQASWPETDGLLEEVALRRAVTGEGAAEYSLEVRYRYEAAGRTLEGAWTQGHTTNLPFYEAQALAAAYAPEAAALTDADIGFLDNRRSWRLPWPGVKVRLRVDPAAPESSVMVVPGTSPIPTLPPAVVWAIAGGLMLLGGFGVVAALFMPGAATRSGVEEP